MAASSRLPVCVLACAALSMGAATSPLRDAFFPGQQWNDTDGNRISARGAGFLGPIDKVYYWFGQFNETKTLRNNAISAYSSTDLYNWKFEGIVFRASDITIAPPEGTTLYMERPKVVHSPKGDFVLYFKLMASPGSVIRQLGVARSATPTGQFAFEHGVFPAGQDAGDLTVYDNRAHQQAADPEFAVVFTGDLRDPNASVIVSPLALPAIDNTTSAGECGRVPARREGEAVFWDARNEQYTLVTSHTTGWKPNPSEWFVSKSLCGNMNWTSIGNRAMGSTDTYGAQSTFALELSGGNVVLMMDEWNWEADKLLNMSTYVWLPVQYDQTDGLPMVSWHDKWDLSIFGE